MNIGVVIPQTAFGKDLVVVLDYAQTMESLEFSHIAAYDHALGANPEPPGGCSLYSIGIPKSVAPRGEVCASGK